jgi:hypothetical protein
LTRTTLPHESRIFRQGSMLYNLPTLSFHNPSFRHNFLNIPICLLFNLEKLLLTARRLGALFEGLCPPTPNLIIAYGIRALEIAQAAAKNSPADFSKTMFAPYLGVDATSIWAAATSSKAALPVHLLNCMLASVFEAPEAISI